jgi:5-methylcytosine-specific restriction endonuclease McrBC regulatory subunit McrC
MFPDIVMKKKKDGKVMVFDAKYKRMKFEKGMGDGKRGDLDRSDFFQVNTYMSYYHNQKDKHLISGGLLYPFEKEFDINEAHSDNWFGNDSVQFIVDGIDLSKIDDIKEMRTIEKEFINRIKELTKKND